MTNGEKIKEIFPNINIYEHGSTYSINNEYNFNASWWNAEYKEPIKNEAKYCDRNICLKNEYNNVGCEDCEVTKSQEPTTKNDLGVNCISRKRVLEWLENATDDSIEHAIDSNLEFIPSITPQEPRKGHWLRRPHVYGVTYCSVCDFELKIDNTNYCPNCVTDMREVK